MKAKELMIGDWILYGEKPRQVRYINDRVWWDKSCHNNEIGFTHHEDEWIAAHNAKPILLTPEILKKNGWWYDVEEMWLHDKVDFGIERCKGGFQCYNINQIKLDSVHQLQHALRICGLDELADNFKV